MRLIDQSGKIDVLYDMVFVFEEDGVVRCRLMNGVEVVLAEYSSDEIALKVLQQMRASYQLMNVSVFKFPKECDL